MRFWSPRESPNTVLSYACYRHNKRLRDWNRSFSTPYLAAIVSTRFVSGEGDATPYQRTKKATAALQESSHNSVKAGVGTTSESGRCHFS